MKRIPHPLPEAFRVRDLLTDEQPAEVRLGPADRRLHDARRHAEDFGEPAQSVVGVNANARERLDSALVGVDLAAHRR